MIAQPVCALAPVIPLPTAAAKQVKQPSRRGRFPKGITNIADARFKRFLKECNQKQAALDIEAAIANALKFEEIAQVWHQRAMDLRSTQTKSHVSNK